MKRIGITQGQAEGESSAVPLKIRVWDLPDTSERRMTLA